MFNGRLQIVLVSVVSLIVIVAICRLDSSTFGQDPGGGIGFACKQSEEFCAIVPMCFQAGHFCNHCTFANQAYHYDCVPGFGPCYSLGYLFGDDGGCGYIPGAQCQPINDVLTCVVTHVLEDKCGARACTMSLGNDD